MIKKNNFYIENLKSVVFIGQSDVFLELIKINKSLNLNTVIITSPHQSKLIKEEIDFKVFNKLDNKFKNFVNNNVKVKNTIFVSLGARFIFTKDMIKEFFSNNIVNFHGTRLPLDAGGGGFSWKIMREDRIDNQLVHLVNHEIDKGPIIHNTSSLFPKECQIPMDFEKYRLQKFITFYKEFLKKLRDGNHFELKSQPSYLGRYNPRLNTEIDGFINWDMKSYELINFINAFDDPYKGASTFLNRGKFGKLYLKKVHLHGGDSSNHPFMSGIVSRHDKNWIVVSTKSKHMLLVEKILDKKGKNIIKDIKVGDRFYSPLKELQKSKKNRTIFTSKGLKKK